MKVSLRFVLAIFALGALSVLPARADAPQTTGRWQRIQSRLGLSTSELERVKPVLQRYRESRRNRIDALSAQIREILTPAQKSRFDALLTEHDQRRASGNRARGRHGLREFVTSLDLSPKQILTVTQLAQASASQARTEHERFLEQVRQFLTPEQYARLEEMTRWQRGGESD